jgi:hypothetical protein
MHPAILLDLFRTGYLTREQLSVAEREALQVLMCEQAIAGYIPTVRTVEPKPIEKPAEKPKYGKLIGTWGGKLHKVSRRRKVA